MGKNAESGGLIMASQLHCNALQKQRKLMEQKNDKKYAPSIYSPVFLAKWWNNTTFMFLIRNG